MWEGRPSADTQQRLKENINPARREREKEGGGSREGRELRHDSAWEIGFLQSINAVQNVSPLLVERTKHRTVARTQSY